MAAEKLLFPRRWYGGMISTDLEVIWEIPAYTNLLDALLHIESFGRHNIVYTPS
jgi:hypothetical protein